MSRLSLYQALTGSALLVVPDNELDSTAGEVPAQSRKGTAETQATPDGNPGVGILSKLVFFGLIAGVVMMFLKSRNASADRGLP